MITYEEFLKIRDKIIKHGTAIRNFRNANEGERRWMSPDDVGTTVLKFSGQLVTFHSSCFGCSIVVDSYEGCDRLSCTYPPPEEFKIKYYLNEKILKDMLRDGTFYY
jgi:hypothetical protein